MKNILLIVDVQEGFARYQQTRQAAERIVMLSQSNCFDAIVATRFINKKGSQFTEILHWNRLINSPDIDLVEGINADYIIEKNLYTCVTHSFIDMLTKINDGTKPTHLFVAGIDTDCCVLKIASDLFESYIMPLVLVDYCASNGGSQSHSAGIIAMNRIIGKNSIIEGPINSKEDAKNIVSKRKFKID